MDKRMVFLFCFVIAGVLLGVGIVGKENGDPIMKELLNQQQVVLSSQKRIEQRIGSEGSVGGNSLFLMKRLDEVEERLDLLEERLENAPVQPRAAAAQAPTQPSDEFTKVHQIDVAHSYVYGNPKAPITIVEFVDFECPFCARFHEPMVAAVNAYPNKVNYIIKNFPLSFHPNARPAAKAALAAGEQGKYFEMADELLKNGRALGEAKYKELAQNLGLDVDKFMKDYSEKTPKWEDIIQKDMNLGQKVEVRGTPTFYINGQKTVARDVAAYKAEIEKILNGK
ncbi:MAG: thioredoxin domain-containing protein [Candidatus Omnitrophica bacterium]|nr:thioredoxin domain-containing protein [Candidatus Omnitrophota bacterium]MCB9747164.1 thioredoxin domain-containing protein [Candidatus Omnitrophota bacterium]